MELNTEVFVLIVVLEVCKTVYFLKKLYQVSVSCKQALIFSRVQSSTDLMRSGSHGFSNNIKHACSLRVMIVIKTYFICPNGFTECVT